MEGVLDMEVINFNKMLICWYFVVIIFKGYSSM